MKERELQSKHFNDLGAIAKGTIDTHILPKYAWQLWYWYIIGIMAMHVVESSV